MATVIDLENSARDLLCRNEPPHLIDQLIGFFSLERECIKNIYYIRDALPLPPHLLNLTDPQFIFSQNPILTPIFKSLFFHLNTLH